MRVTSTVRAIGLCLVVLFTFIIIGCGAGDVGGGSGSTGGTPPPAGSTNTPDPTPTEPFPIPTDTDDPSGNPTPTPTDTGNPKPTPTQTDTPSPTPTNTGNPTPTPTQPSPTPTKPSPTPTQPSPTPTQPTPTQTQPSPTPTQPSPTPTQPSPTPTQPSPTPTQPSPTPTQTPTGWLGYVNGIRAVGNLPPLTEVSSYVSGNVLHSKYMVKNNVIMHDEDPSMPYYTVEGRDAARNSNIYVTSSSSLDYRTPIDAWITGPFHAVGLLDPRLLRTGYAGYSEADGGYQSGAGIDVLRGRGSVPAEVNFPIMWPAHGKTVGLYRYGGSESPDPLTGTGYSAPTGLPIYLMLGTGSITPSVTDHYFRKDGVNLQHVVYSETTYTNPNASQQSLGRNVLNSRDAIVLIPRDPLTKGATYDVMIKANGVTYAWSFTVSSTARGEETTRGADFRIW